LFELLPGGKRRLIVSIPKLNYCDILRHAKKTPIVSDFLKEFFKYSNYPTSCPMQKGRYYIKDFFLADMAIPMVSMLANNGKYVVKVAFTDENAKLPINIYKYNLFFSFMKGVQKLS
jgi:hypothetical protein